MPTQSLLQRLLAIQLAAIRRRTPESVRAYDEIDAAISRLRSSDASFLERLRILDHLATAGWSECSDWAVLRLRWLARSPEFATHLSDEDMDSLLAGGDEAQRVLMAIARRWAVDTAAHLRVPLAMFLGNRPVVAWVIFGVWFTHGDESFSRWLLEQVGYRPRRRDGDGEAGLAVVLALRAAPPAELHDVIAYLRKTLKNRRIDVVRTEARRSRRHLSSAYDEAAVPDPDSKQIRTFIPGPAATDWVSVDGRYISGPTPPELESVRIDADDERAIEDLELWAQMEALLTERQRAIVRVIVQSERRPTNREIGQRLGLSSSVVERDLSDARRRMKGAVTAR